MQRVRAPALSELVGNLECHRRTFDSSPQLELRFGFFLLFLFEKFFLINTKSIQKLLDHPWRKMASSARQAHLPCEQQPYYREEDGEHEEDVGRAHHRVVGQLVRLAAHFVDVEADGEDERCHAEQDHCREERGGGGGRQVRNLRY